LKSPAEGRPGNTQPSHGLTYTSCQENCKYDGANQLRNEGTPCVPFPVAPWPAGACSEVQEAHGPFSGSAGFLGPSMQFQAGQAWVVYPSRRYRTRKIQNGTS
jgi:hypothetical protein